MVRISHIGMIGLLAVSSSCGVDQAQVAPADDESFRIHKDGTVVVGDRVYPSMEAFHASAEFRQGDLRCATPRPDPASLPMNFAPTDCTYDATSIETEYVPGVVYEIPVVVHVIERNNGTGYIDDALVRSQIDVLNEDFRALPGTPGAPGTDTRIQFVLATVDPDGNSTTGIYHYTNNNWFVDPGPGANNDMKATIGWDTTRYFNIYTNDGSGGGTLGYATFPTLSAGDYDDGVVLNWANVGRDAPDGGIYNLGRTATHEIGHYLGLFHTFQDGCGSASFPYTTGDLIADTAAEQEPQFDCIVATSACGGADNPIENYMDYTNDACMDRFTVEQAHRMRCSLLHYRSTLFASSGLPGADFAFTVTGTTVDFTDQSSDPNGTLAAWQWDFGDGATSTEQNPSHTYAAAGGNYDVLLTVIDNDGQSDQVLHTVTIAIPPSAAFSHSANALRVSFTDQSSDPDGTVTAWQWDFGDGTGSNQASPMHTYAADGTYSVSLMVTDNDGNTDTAAMDVSVSAPSMPDAGMPPDSGDGNADGDGGGCSCEIRGTDRGPNGPALALFGLALIALRRRRA